MDYVNRFASYFHIAFWVFAFLIWLSGTTAHHPNWTLRITCTLVLILMSALYACCFTPRAISVGSIVVSLISLCGCGVFAAILIHLLYDSLIGPDPRRFGFVSNIAMDTAIVAFNTILAACFASIVRATTGRPTWFLR